MAQDGEINLGQVKASYSIDDIILIDVRELSFINEFRLLYEISFAIGLTVLGTILTSFNTILATVSGIFLLFGGYNLYRYISGSRKMEKRINKQKIQETGKKELTWIGE